MARLLLLGSIVLLYATFWCSGADSAITASENAPREQPPKPGSPAGNAQPVKPQSDAPVSVTLPLQPPLQTFKPAKILVLLPMPLYSHTKNYMPIFLELARKGHHITMVSPFPQKDPPPNWEDIEVENLLPKLMTAFGDMDFAKKTSFLEKILAPLPFGDRMITLALETETITTLMKDDSRSFDLVCVEAQFTQEPLLAFGIKYGAPVIGLSPNYVAPEVAYYSGNPIWTFTYVPSLSFPFSKHMSFTERVTNSLNTFVKLAYYNLVYLPKMDSVMRKYFKWDNIPYVGDMLFNISLTLLDENEMIAYPYPKANNMRGFLGINTKPAGALPEDLEAFLDEAEEGVLFFTLGSLYQPSNLRPHILSALLSAFSRLPHKVLMKWDKDEPPTNASNVFVRKWFPQSAILAHRNCKAFLTHTGVHGLAEAVDHAVPVISIPLFADQGFFAKWVVETGMGRSIDIETITPEIVYEAISDVFKNDKYKTQAIENSKLLKDLPQPKLEEVTYWVEHVIRTKGARHLRPGSLDLTWYQRFGLDLLAAALVVTLVPLWLLFKMLSCLVTLCRGKQKSQHKNDKAKKDK